MYRLASPLPPLLAELCSQTVAGPRNGLSEPGEPVAERSGMWAGARSMHQDMPFPGEAGRTPKRAPCRLRKPPGPPAGRPSCALFLCSNCKGTHGNSPRSHGAPRVCLGASLSLRQDGQTQLSPHTQTLGNARNSAAPSHLSTPSCTCHRFLQGRPWAWLGSLANVPGSLPLFPAKQGLPAVCVTFP